VPRRATKADGLLIVLALALAAIGTAMNWLLEHWILSLLLIAVVAIGYAIITGASRRAPTPISPTVKTNYAARAPAAVVIGQNLWQGQTEDQLRESLGRPAVIDTQLLKTKRKEIWKYYERRKGQYGLRVTLENGRVVAWDKKQ
jgi:hypothetical protein